MTGDGSFADMIKRQRMTESLIEYLDTKYPDPDSCSEDIRLYLAAATFADLLVEGHMDKSTLIEPMIVMASHNHEIAYALLRVLLTVVDHAERSLDRSQQELEKMDPDLLEQIHEHLSRTPEGSNS